MNYSTAQSTTAHSPAVHRMGRTQRFPSTVWGGPGDPVNSQQSLYHRRHRLRTEAWPVGTAAHLIRSGQAGRTNGRRADSDSTGRRAGHGAERRQGGTANRRRDHMAETARRRGWETTGRRREGGTARGWVANHQSSPRTRDTTANSVDIVPVHRQLYDHGFLIDLRDRPVTCDNLW